MLQLSHIHVDNLHLCIANGFVLLIDSEIKFTAKPFDAKDSYISHVATLLKKPELL